jgi:hypothetical protein
MFCGPLDRIRIVPVLLRQILTDAAFALTEGWLREQSRNHHYTPVPAKPRLGAKLSDQAYDLGPLDRIIGQ